MNLGFEGVGAEGLNTNPAPAGKGAQTYWRTQKAVMAS